MNPETKVAFLGHAAAYPELTRQVEIIETHISWVFLTDRFAYKLKKPVRFPYLDFRTVDARHQDALAEIRLNRRLAGRVYLDLVALRVAPDGELTLGGEGRTVDWLVRMRRLPAAKMLDRMIREREATPPALMRIGERLARFYREQPPIDIEPTEYRTLFAEDIDENHRELGDPTSGLPRVQIDRICRRQEYFLQMQPQLLDARVDAGRILEGHGDLRPEHVCVLDEPVVIDCLEFKRAFRLLDAVDELGYLALECQRLGAGWAEAPLLERYTHVTGDHPPPALIHFYQSFRAMVRAKIAIWHNHDDSVRSPDHWVRRAIDYLELAQRHADGFDAAL